MKKLLFTLSMFCALTGFSQTNIVATTNAPTAGWVAPVTVQAVAVGNRIRNMSFSITPNGVFSAVICWEWIDAQGKVVRNGTQRYDEEGFNKAIAPLGFSVPMLKAMAIAITQTETTALANQ